MSAPDIRFLHLSPIRELNLNEGPGERHCKYSSNEAVF